jgi:hypothetical protein
MHVRAHARTHNTHCKFSLLPRYHYPSRHLFLTYLRLEGQASALQLFYDAIHDGLGDPGKDGLKVVLQIKRVTWAVAHAKLSAVLGHDMHPMDGLMHRMDGLMHPMDGLMYRTRCIWYASNGGYVLA